mmetsp:Transcript_25677/g.56224  ORF Transcript_25677/g.56224 Transcript_25677/m.56224 type:complete len:218 (-) Transcript_25677:733-1386(-)
MTTTTKKRRSANKRRSLILPQASQQMIQTLRVVTLCTILGDASAEMSWAVSRSRLLRSVLLCAMPMSPACRSSIEKAAPLANSQQAVTAMVEQLTTHPIPIGGTSRFQKGTKLMKLVVASTEMSWVSSKRVLFQTALLCAMPTCLACRLSIRSRAKNVSSRQAATALISQPTTRRIPFGGILRWDMPNSKRMFQVYLKLLLQFRERRPLMMRMPCPH